MASPPPAQDTARGSSAVRSSSARARSAAAIGGRLATVLEGSAEAESAGTEEQAVPKASGGSMQTDAEIFGAWRNTTCASTPPPAAKTGGAGSSGDSTAGPVAGPGSTLPPRKKSNKRPTDRRDMGMINSLNLEPGAGGEERTVDPRLRRPPPDDGQLEGDVHDGGGQVVGRLIWMPHRGTYAWEDAFSDEILTHRPRGVRGRGWQTGCVGC